MIDWQVPMSQPILPNLQSPSARLEHMLEEAIAARRAGRYQEALDRLGACDPLLTSGPVRRALRVALPHERGLAALGLGRAAAARDSLLLALERADGEPTLVDPLRAALASLRLMGGDIHATREILKDRGRDRRGTLMALARTQLYEGQTSKAETTLQTCEQAPGGISALAPPSTALRCLAAIWAGRTDQAQMLYDGVSTGGSPYWDLVRLVILRALWAQSGDGRYLQLALGAAEQLRFQTDPTVPPGMGAAAAAHHAVLLSLSGDTAMAVDAADQALSRLGELTLPEWPRQAILHDLAVVYRDGDQRDLWQQMLDARLAIDQHSWPERMTQLTGPRARMAVALPASAVNGDSGGIALTDIALKMVEDPRPPHLTILAGLCSHAAATGGQWKGSDGHTFARVGTALVGSDSSKTPRVDLIDVDGAGTITLYGARPNAFSASDTGVLARLHTGANAVLATRHQRAQLLDAIAVADTGRKHAEGTLESMRRPGMAPRHDAAFGSVLGRSPRLREVLDRLAAMRPLTLPVLIEGATGTGRRHLAQAFAALGGEVGAPAPILDLALIPAATQLDAIEECLRPRAEGGPALLILAHGEHLSARSWSVVRTRLSAMPRIVITLDKAAETSVAVQIRAELLAGHVMLPGLDERLEDLPLLLDGFVREVGRRPEDLSTAARAVLARRIWPGHIQELRTAVQHA
ncbi:MAG: hypothetical protein ACI9MR_004583, partial [Myxococcota bacterium]